MRLHQPENLNLQRGLSRSLAVIFLLFVLVLVSAAVLSLRDRPGRDAMGNSRIARTGTGESIEYFLAGPERGTSVVLIPSFGRAAQDFNELAAALNAVGFRTLSVNPPGVGGSSLPITDFFTINLFAYAERIRSVVAEEVPTGTVHVVGHAFGNRVARAYASRYSDRLGQLVLIAAGDGAPPKGISEHIGTALLSLAGDDARRAAVQKAFFTANSDIPSYWLEGWYPLAGLLQAQALKNTDVSAWQTAGGHPMTIIQPAKDAAAPASGAALAQQLGSQVTLHTLADAGHAALPEQPDRLASLIIERLQGNTASTLADVSETSDAAQGTGAPSLSPPVATSAEVATGTAEDYQDWPLHGLDAGETRFSTLDNINRDNVSELGLAWAFDDKANRALEATPIVVDGVMYVSGYWNTVYAIDAKTGQELWSHDPQVDRRRGRYLCCDAVNRGVAVADGKVFIGTLDGRLVALDAASGAKLWDTLTIDLDKSYSITGAPRVIDDLVIIGNGGAEYGVRGYITAYDADTGEQAWRFYTVPGNPAEGFESELMAKAAETWTGEWWKLGGGGTVWDHMAWDPELDLLYIGVGNGSPWNRRLRSPEGGDNLFLSSIVAVRPKTGEYVWHYQVVPAETWDYTATQHMILADIEWQGQPRKVLMQAPKSGFFMVLDRETGKLLSAEPFARVTWASHYDLETGRPVEVPGQDYSEGEATVYPSSGGAHNWQPMALNPEHGLVYIPKMEAPYHYVEPEKFTVEPGWRNLGTDGNDTPAGNAALSRAMVNAVAQGSLLAWDIQQAKPRWEVPLPTPWNGGVLATAGDLVFQGNGDSRLVAYDAATGQVLWQAETQSPILAAPITYQIDGEQYVTIAAGGGGAFGLMAGIEAEPTAPVARFLTYKLGGQQQLPALPTELTHPEPVAQRPGITDDDIERGGELFVHYCSYCHGMGAVSGGTLPDLRWLSEERHQQLEAIVLGGALSTLGMPGFGDLIDADELKAIQGYIIDKAHTDHAYDTSPDWVKTVKSVWYDLLAVLVGWFMGGSAASA